jgi:hypothetical protein
MGYLDRLRFHVTPPPLRTSPTATIAACAWGALGIALGVRAATTEGQLIAYHAADAALGALGVATANLPLVPTSTDRAAAIRELLRATPTPTPKPKPAPSVDRAVAPAPEPPQRDATHNPDGRRRWPTRPR